MGKTHSTKKNICLIVEATNLMFEIPNGNLTLHLIKENEQITLIKIPSTTLQQWIEEGVEKMNLQTDFFKSNASQ
jgi:hypothetical protein